MLLWIRNRYKQKHVVKNYLFKMFMNFVDNVFGLF